MYDKQLLKTNHAGIRLIAQTTIYNGADFERLRRFILDSYRDDLFARYSADQWLQMFRNLYAEVGRLRVRQVIAHDENHVVILMEAENADGYYIHDLEVESDYPHKIIAYNQYPIG